MSNLAWTVPLEKHPRMSLLGEPSRIIYLLHYVFKWRSLERSRVVSQLAKALKLKKHTRNQVFQFLIQWYFFDTLSKYPVFGLLFWHCHLKVSGYPLSPPAGLLPWSGLRMAWAVRRFLPFCGFSLLYEMLFREKGEGQAEVGFILKFTSSWKEAGPDKCILRKD